MRMAQGDLPHSLSSLALDDRWVQPILRIPGVRDLILLWRTTPNGMTMYSLRTCRATFGTPIGDCRHCPCWQFLRMDLDLPAAS